MKPGVALLAPALAISLAAGCGSLSDSSTSIGRSSNALSDSLAHSSDSSGSSSGEKQAAFLRDVRDYAARFARDGGEPEALERDLGALARGHGILDWEADDGTWLELGAGFAEADVDPVRLAALTDRLAAADAHRRSLLLHGYASSTAP